MFFRYNYLAFLWALIILILCAIPGNHIPQLRFIDWLKPDKIVHLILFGVLSFLLIRGFQQQTTYPTFYNHARLYAILFSAVYGVVIELLQQYLFIKRSGEVFDAVADTVGALLGMWVFNYLMKKKLAKKIF